MPCCEHGQETRMQPSGVPNLEFSDASTAGLFASVDDTHGRRYGILCLPLWTNSSIGTRLNMRRLSHRKHEAVYSVFRAELKGKQGRWLSQAGDHPGIIAFAMCAGSTITLFPPWQTRTPSGSTKCRVRSPDRPAISASCIHAPKHNALPCGVAPVFFFVIAWIFVS